MNRLLMIASVAFLLTGATGCLHHNTRGGCGSGHCSSGGSSTGGCSTCSGGHGGGLLGKLHKGGGSSCGNGGCSTCGGGRTGCVPGPLGWQQGGMNYSSHLGHAHGPIQGNGTGGIGHGAIAQHLAPGHYAAQQLQSQPFNPGPPTGTVAYPYYTHRGPRDFLLDNPPTIGR